MRFTQAQKDKLLALRQTFIIQLALIAARRQQLMQQLQRGPEPFGCSNVEMYAEHLNMEQINVRLQQNQVLRHKLWTQYYIAISSGVRLLLLGELSR